MAKAPSSVKTASVLAFERKLAVSDALMYAGNGQGGDWQPIAIVEKAVRGTISNRQGEKTANDPLKLNAAIEKPNLQRVDTAALSANTDTLKIEFTLRILGNLSLPSVCNNMAYLETLQKIIDGYIAEHGFGELAHRYATNLANGRYLWRNRIGAGALYVTITGSKSWEFDGYDYSLRDFDVRTPDLNELAQEIERGLSGDGFMLLKVAAYVRLGAGQEVFPSQELVLDDSSTKKSRILYQVNDIAGIHSQKIGNALRTIDTWHPASAETGAIAVEPFGSVTSRSKAYRQPSDKMDFYTLFDNWVLKGKVPPVEQQHYIMAVLIRGGVFGEKDKSE